MIQSVIFTKEECDRIINSADNLPKLYTDGGWENTSTVNFTNYEIYNTEDNKWIFDRLLTFLKTNILEELISEPVKIDLLKYEKNDAFQLHRDSFFDRKYAVGCLLNDEFEGGNFIVNTANGPFEVQKKAGNSYFFDVRLFHEVKRIESGTRWSLITFILNKNLNKKMKSVI